MGDRQSRPELRARRVHAYAASFGEDLAGGLIARFTRRGSLVLDPFAGAGTTLLQARLLGRGAICIDVDPVACLIAKVLSTSYTPNELDELRETMEEQLGEIETALCSCVISDEVWRAGVAFSVNGIIGRLPKNNQIEFWFAPVQRAVIAVLVELAESWEDSRLKNVVRLAISSAIIHKWPHTLSQAMDVDHSRPHRVLRDDLSVQSQMDVFRRTFRGVIRTLRKLNERVAGQAVPLLVIEGDSTVEVGKLKENSVDYVLTSPPYFNAIDYPRAHQFSKWWLWPERSNLKRSEYTGLRSGGTDGSVTELCEAVIPCNIGGVSRLRAVSMSRYRALCRYVLDLDALLGGTKRALRSGKVASLVLANNSIRAVTVPVVEIVCELLDRHGFAGIATERRQINVSRRRYPYGLKGFRGLMDTEYVIHARKPARRRSRAAGRGRM